MKQLGWKKGKSNQKWLIPYSIHFPGKITKSLKKTSKMLWPHCAPNPMQIDQYKRKCSAVLDRPLVQWGEANWLTKKGRVLLLKIMPLFCYFRRITIGSSPFWEWSKSQQALAEALGPILTKIVQKLSLLSFKNVIIVTILKRHLYNYFLICLSFMSTKMLSPSPVLIWFDLQPYSN